MFYVWGSISLRPLPITSPPFESSVVEQSLHFYWPLKLRTDFSKLKLFLYSLVLFSHLVWYLSVADLPCPSYHQGAQGLTWIVVVLFRLRSSERLFSSWHRRLVRWRLSSASSSPSNQTPAQDMYQVPYLGTKDVMEFFFTLPFSYLKILDRSLELNNIYFFLNIIEIDYNICIYVFSTLRRSAWYSWDERGGRGQGSHAPWALAGPTRSR